MPTLFYTSKPQHLNYSEVVTLRMSLLEEKPD